MKTTLSLLAFMLVWVQVNPPHLANCCNHQWRNGKEFSNQSSKIFTSKETQRKQPLSTNWKQNTASRSRKFNATTPLRYRAAKIGRRLGGSNSPTTWKFGDLRKMRHKAREWPPLTQMMLSKRRDLKSQKQRRFVGKKKGWGGTTLKISVHRKSLWVSFIHRTGLELSNTEKLKHLNLTYQKSKHPNSTNSYPSLG